MRIILHADDFGFDKDTTLETIRCFENNFISSASIMANMPSTKNAIDFAKNNPQFSFGIHLTYVDGIVPLSEVKKISGLLDKNKRFKPSNQIRIRALLGLLSKKQIIEETKKQIGFLLDSGVNLSHIDSHGHIHKFPIFQDAIRDVIFAFGINKVRKVQDVFLNNEETKISNRIFKSFDTSLKRKFQTTDYFYMPASSMDVNWSDKIITKLSTFKQQEVIEIGVHPGTKENWRLNELIDIEKFNLVLNKSIHKVINWNEL